METVSDALHLSTLFKALQTTVLCVVFLANLLGNICVCLAVIRVSSLRRRPMASILASLALSDIASLSFTLFRLVWVYDVKAACMNYQYFFTILTTLLYVSSVHICLLSCDRFVAIVHPLRYKEVVTKERVRRALVFAWSVPLVATITVPWIYHEGRVPFTAALVGCVELEIEPSQAFKIHVACNFAFFVVIPFAVMIFVYSYIGKVARSQNERVWAGEHLTPELAERERRRKKEMKWMRTISKFGSNVLPLLLILTDLILIVILFFGVVVIFILLILARNVPNSCLMGILHLDKDHLVCYFYCLL